MNKVLEKVIKKISTKKHDKEISKAYSDTKTKLETAILSLKINCSVFLGGSLAKGTMLSNNKEIDIFLRFTQDYKNKELSELAEKILKRTKIKFKRVHGSRDYFQSHEDEFMIEFIPIYEIKNSSEAKNITDISPLHVLWVDKKINSLEDDVKLAKQFCKSAKVYGAESHIQGLSGYVLEILVIYYGGFEKLLKAASKWKDKVIIDPENYFKGKNVEDEMNKAKRQSPLIIVDPVQKERNVAAALSKKSFEKFILYSKEFLANPSEDFFEIKEIQDKELIEEAKALDSYLVNIKVKAAGDKSDVIGGKVRKLKQFLEKNLKKKGFNIVEDYWTLNDIWFIFNPEKLPLTYEHKGPFSSKKDAHYKKFIEKHKDTFVKGKYIYAKVKNKDRDIESCIKNIFNTFIKNYKKDIKITKISRLL